MDEPNKTLLVVHHSRSGGTESLAEAVIAGARDDAIENVSVRCIDALQAGPDDVLNANAIIVGTPENFGAMSGAIKYFFETVYYPCLDRTRGLPYGLFIKAGNDGTGARQGIERIITGLGWREVAPTLVVVGEIKPADLVTARELGMTVAAGLEAGVF